jgi:hypothetical protein
VLNGSRSGIYQKLSNLVIGQLYNITINVSTTGTGSIIIYVCNGTTIVAGQSTLVQQQQQ